jgi:hypothetical protein
MFAGRSALGRGGGAGEVTALAGALGLRRWVLTRGRGGAYKRRPRWRGRSWCRLAYVV